MSIDHYVPRAHALARIDDPHNLLLGCSNCNGPGGKWDYHPAHMERRKWKWDHTGYLVLDVREDDFSDLYEISRDGEIHPRAGEGHGRASWNISLLKLDLKKYEKSRALNLDFFQQAEEILRLLSDPDHERSHAAFAGVLAPLVQYLARHRAFFLAFDLVMSPELQARVDAEAREAVEHLLTAVGVASASA